jgi:hypothetical protein
MVLCKCEIKYEQIVVSELVNETNILSNNNFNNVSSNTFTMKCFYTLFTKEGIIKNIEHYILMFIIIIFIILGILFYKCGYPSIES